MRRWFTGLVLLALLLTLASPAAARQIDEPPLTVDLSGVPASAAPGAQWSLNVLVSSRSIATRTVKLRVRAGGPVDLLRFATAGGTCKISGVLACELKVKSGRPVKVDLRARVQVGAAADTPVELQATAQDDQNNVAVSNPARLTVSAAAPQEPPTVVPPAQPTACTDAARCVPTSTIAPAATNAPLPTAPPVEAPAAPRPANTAQPRPAQENPAPTATSEPSAVPTAEPTAVAAVPTAPPASTDAAGSAPPQTDAAGSAPPQTDASAAPASSAPPQTDAASSAPAAPSAIAATPLALAPSGALTERPGTLPTTSAIEPLIILGLVLFGLALALRGASRTWRAGRAIGAGLASSELDITIQRVRALQRVTRRSVERMQVRSEAIEAEIRKR